MPVPETNNEDHVAAKNDEQDSQGNTKETVELVRTCTQERQGGSVGV